MLQICNSWPKSRECYGHMFITHLEIGNPTTCVYHFVIGKSNEHPVVIVQIFIIYGLVIWINLNYHIAHTFYGFNYSHCTTVYIMFMNSKYSLCTDDDTTVFFWGVP